MLVIKFKDGSDVGLDVDYLWRMIQIREWLASHDKTEEAMIVDGAIDEVLGAMDHVVDQSKVGVA